MWPTLATMHGTLVLSLFAGCAGHGYILDPPPRAAAPRVRGDVKGVAGSAVGGISLWFNQGCTIGCRECTGKQDGSCWEQGPATLPDHARTWRRYGETWGDCGNSPWCSPGSSPVFSPCGRAGGGPIEDGGAGGTPPPGFKQNFDGINLPEHPTKTVWKAGDVVEAQWSLIANHGGGYQYRLCPRNSAQTEECFQQTPMEFFGDKQYIQYCANDEQLHVRNDNPGYFPACENKSRQEVPAHKVTTGTTPKGSTWMRNPIPACITTNPWHPGGGSVNCGQHDGTDQGDFMFPPVGQDYARSGKRLGGYGGATCDWPDQQGNHCWDHYEKALFRFNIVDKLVVPRVPPGDYVLSFRWDCEMGPQIWTLCSDVTITAPDLSTYV